MIPSSKKSGEITDHQFYTQFSAYAIFGSGKIQLGVSFKDETKLKIPFEIKLPLPVMLPEIRALDNCFLWL